MSDKDEVLVVRARHYKDAKFNEPCHCPLAEAGKEHFPTANIEECVYCLIINRQPYLHKNYDVEHFLSDLKIATSNNFDDTIIRKIALTPV